MKGKPGEEHLKTWTDDTNVVIVDADAKVAQKIIANKYKIEIDKFIHKYWLKN